MREVSALIWFFVLVSYEGVNSQCSKQDYKHCVKLADPLLRDPHLIYPDNARDIELVCRTWSYFVDCVKQYTDRCFTEAKRQEFNKAVESPVSTIHKLCSMPDFRDDYMKHAGCMKMTLTQDTHCGRHYRLLVSQVSSEEAPTASICCSHHLFRECVIDHTKNACEPESAPYSAVMLDKAFSFLKEQCANFMPNQLDCPGADFYKSTGRSETRLADQEATLAYTPSSSFTPISDPTSQSTGSTWTTQLTTSNRHTSTDRQSSTENRGVMSPVTFTARPATEPSNSPIPWTPSTRFEPSTDSGDVMRTSYARGMSWRPSSVEGAIDSTGGSDTTQTWRVTSSDIWLPSSRPVMIDNAIDEPNQQGLESRASIMVSFKIIPICMIFILFR
ncbi:uncharacterized protein [Rhodnius prolixus]